MAIIRSNPIYFTARFFSTEKWLKRTLTTLKQDQSLIRVVLTSTLSMIEKEHLLDMLLQAKEMEVMAKEMEVSYLKERVIELGRQKDQEALYKLHYQQLLTVRAVIELYEKNFGTKITKKNMSRMNMWTEYLQSADERSKPFKEAGFSVDQVSDLVDKIYKSHSAEIHSVKVVEGLVLRKGSLSKEQLSVVKVIIEQSGWEDFVTIQM